MQVDIPMPILGKDPPEKYRVYTWGVNLTEKGPLYLTKESAPLIMDEFYRRGNVLAFNINHQESDETLGHFKLALQDDGIWMDPIQWTEEGKQAVREGKLIYISPEILFNKETQEIVAITGMALTNNPATNHLKPLALTLGMNMDQTKQEPMTVHPLKQILTGMQMSIGCAQDALSSDNGMMDEDMKGLLTDVVEGLSSHSTKIMDALEKLGVEKEPKEEEPDGDEYTLATPKETEKRIVKTETIQSLTLTQHVMQDLQTNSEEEAVGAYLALKSNLESAQTRLKEAEKRELQLMVELGVSQRKISPSEKSKYLKLTKKQIQTFLANREADEEQFSLSVNEMPADVAVKPMNQIPQTDKDSLNRAFKECGLPLLT